MAYLGQTNREIYAKSRREDEYVANGAQTDFILSQAVPGAFATNIIVIVNGQIKDPYDDYTITGSNWTTLHFTVAPTDTHKIVVVHLGEQSQFVAPSTGSVTADALDPNLRNFASDVFTGNGVQMNFTLSQEAATSQSLLVMVEGVVQDPATNYTASGTTLAFLSPPDNGTSIRVLHLGFKTAVAYPIAGSIGAEQLDPALRLFNVTDLTGTGSTATFTMTQSETSANAIIVSIEGVIQTPGTNYSVSGNQITFTSNPAGGAKIHIRHMGMVMGVTDIVAVANGGTGATDAAGARTNLGAASSSHNHDGVYSATNHDHTGVYSATNHDHTGVYEPVDATILKSAAIGVSVAAQGHNHNGTYEPVDATILRSSAIGVSVQAYDSDLTSWAAIAPSAKQDTLVSGTSIKTVNSTSLLGSGDIVAGDAFLTVQQSWTASQTFDNSTVKVKGSSTGVTTFTSANAGASNYTFNMPAATTSAWISSYHHTVSGPTAARIFTYPDADMSVGYKNIPAVGTKTGSYSLTTADVGKYIQLGSGGAITIPDVTFAEGDVVSIVNNTASTATITCSITTAYISGTDSDKATMTLAARGICTIFFLSGTVCVVSGSVT